MGLSIPKYTSKDLTIMVGSMLPLAMIINSLLFCNRYFQQAGVFVPATVVTFLLLAIGYPVYSLVAISLRERFPEERLLRMRLTLCISIFMIMSGVYLSLICRGYDMIGFLGYVYDEKNFTIAFLVFVTANFFLTFLNEGVYSFESYKVTVRETEQLKKEYIQSQLLGLKSQMNPHFLFNGLNTLSSLIQEDAEKAEDFLDHMSKVYRYLLRNEEQLVDLQTEVSFIRSYYFLLQARHGDALQLSINVMPAQLQSQLPPLTLQMLVENIINQNTISRAKPLQIEIRTLNDLLIVWNNVQPKMAAAEEDGAGMENIANKFRLLCQREIIIEETGTHRLLQLPLLPAKTVQPA
jgi:two-component system LytT family sensor kinase